jgi:hypothetical protein
MLHGFPSIAKTVRHLLAQTAVKDLEVVIVTASGNASEVDLEMLAQAGGWQIVTIPRFDTAAMGWAAGVKRARAPIAVLCEDHSFPEPDWAEALIAEHTQEWAAVAPVMHNGNPGTKVSWANFLLCFLDWYRPGHTGRVPASPGHNTCYRKSALAAYEDSLEDWFNPEAVLHIDMQVRGLKILQSNCAATHHVNISIAGSYLAHSFFGGRLFGASRAALWPTLKSLAYACAFPMVPLIRLKRILMRLNTSQLRKEARLPGALPWIMAGLLCHAAGEAVGYLAGPGGAMRKYMSFETQRRDHIIAPERSILDDREDRFSPSLH